MIKIVPCSYSNDYSFNYINKYTEELLTFNMNERLRRVFFLSPLLLLLCNFKLYSLAPLNYFPNARNKNK